MILARVASNPLNATFNHYLFESIAALIRLAVRANASAATSFEALLFPVFQQILANDITEFAPYVFQLISMLLEVTPNGVTEPYEALLPPLLSAVLWERSGNVPGLVRLLQAYARRGPDKLAAHIEPTLGVFQQLLASSATDHEAFYLLESLIEHLPPSVTAPYLVTIFQLIFARLKRRKTQKLMRSFLIFLALFVGKHDASAVAQSIESVDTNMFGLVLEKIWLPFAGKVRAAAASFSLRARSLVRTLMRLCAGDGPNRAAHHYNRQRQAADVVRPHAQHVREHVAACRRVLSDGARAARGRGGRRRRR